MERSSSVRMLDRWLDGWITGRGLIGMGTKRDGNGKG